MILALGVEQIWISDFYVSGFQLPDFDISKMNGQEGDTYARGAGGISRDQGGDLDEG